MNKECSKCRVSKPVQFFSKDSSRKDSLSKWCKECVSKKNKLYRIKNNDKIKKQRREYYTLNKSQEISNTNNWRVKNKNKDLETRRKRRKKDIELLTDTYISKKMNISVSDLKEIPEIVKTKRLIIQIKREL